MPWLRVGASGLDRVLEASGLLPRIRKDGAWRACLAGAVAYLAWQATVAAVAIVAYADRARGAPCDLPWICQRLGTWSDGRVAVTTTIVLVASAMVAVAVGAVLIGLWRQRFWSAVASRILGWATVLQGLVLILIGGIPWVLLGAWLVFWSKRLRYEPPTRPAPLPTRPMDPQVIEGERAP